MLSLQVTVHLKLFRVHCKAGDDCALRNKWVWQGRESPDATAQNIYHFKTFVTQAKTEADHREATASNLLQQRRGKLRSIADQKDKRSKWESFEIYRLKCKQISQNRRSAWFRLSHISINKNQAKLTLPNNLVKTRCMVQGVPGLCEELDVGTRAMKQPRTANPTIEWGSSILYIWRGHGKQGEKKCFKWAQNNLEFQVRVNNSGDTNCSWRSRRESFKTPDNT